MTEERIQARRQLVEDLRRYMVGPFANDEVIEESAFDRYHVGILSPTGKATNPEEDEFETGSDGRDQEDGQGDDGFLVLANVKRQSAMGFTCQVGVECQNLVLEASWGTYQTEGPLDAKKRQHWKRHHFSKSLDLDLSQSRTLYKFDDVSLSARAREKDGTRIVTVSVVNEKPESSDREIDNNIYQVKLKVHAEDDSPVFVARPPSDYILDDEFWSYELLFNDARLFAVGHGCAVNWAPLDGQRATKIETEWVPAAEVYKASTAVLEDEPVLLLENLIGKERSWVCDRLEKIPSAYNEWLSMQESAIPSVLDSFPTQHRDKLANAANTNLARCKTASKRIGEGINFLRTDETAWQAFRYANEAMAQAMMKARPNSPAKWRAFQLAFILLSLPSTASEDHPDRRLLDLVWFPTGGGKTEAYLGLAAFAIFHRRLTAKTPGEQAGTAVFTRYTLRVLTIQQYDRSAKMICACEIIRRRHLKDLGNDEISIGLFVGNSATPGTIDKAREILQGTNDPLEASLTTLPLRTCPWCGSTLTTKSQRITDGRLVTACPNVGCDFHERLPLLVVDDEIYAYPPTMLVGTIDKFARMAWKPQIGYLFGLGSQQRPAPSLIIQDELHLIGDSLGTVAALYETAIDYLCTRGGHGPKIVGSTATIRRAEEQASSLFNRKAVQFPASGIRASDSFFYSQDRSHPGRLYVGVHAQGRSPKHTLARTVGTLAQTVDRIKDDRVKDHYYTQVLYFNSLRELGGALVLAEDDVPRYMEAMPRLPEEAVRRLPQKVELNSHIPSSTIPDILKRLTKSVSDDDLNSEPIDLLLATNMISVGMDVDRLGLMVVSGQPKTTSEYIQATSRVGRPTDSAGIVVTLYNWTRPRDRSHYERFVAYHRAFYKYVEATSVTPFSARARDRALRAVLVSLARLALPQFAENDSVRAIQDGKLQEAVRHLMGVIESRVKAIDPEEAGQTLEQLEAILNEWLNSAETPADQLYWDLFKPGLRRKAMLRPAEEDKVSRGFWSTPNSMRDVEPPSPVRLLTASQLGDRNGRRA